MPSKPTILIDFDGVLSQYSGWQGEDVEPGPPIVGARQACFSLARKYKLICFTVRNRVFVEPWLAKHGFSCIEAITAIKIPAFLHIDDRAIEFRGSWADTVEKVKEYKPWWKKEKEEVQ